MSRKRGNVVIDILLFGFILFALATTLLVGDFISDAVNTQLQSSNLEQEAKTDMQQNRENYGRMGDNVFVMAFVLLWVFVFVASFLINSHPLFFGISLFLIVFSFIILATFSNSYDALTSSALSSVTADFPKTIFIMNHLVEFAVAVAFTTLIALYGKAS